MAVTMYGFKVALVSVAFSLLIILSNGNPIKQGKALPEFGKFYSVAGILELPYAEITEPFMAYYDSTTKRSRIDYYNSMVKTFQMANEPQYGNSYKIAPMSDYKVLNKQTCFLSKGAKASPVSIQSVLPDLTGFQYTGQEWVNGVHCDVWKNVTVLGGKRNVYTFYADPDTQTPIRYVMMGFDSLLGSHYDKYYIEYYSFDNAEKPKDVVFKVPSNMTCAGFPGPGMAHRILNNPMQEYIHNDDRHTSELFNEFKNKHKPQYKTEKEHAQRKHNFRQNLRFIHSKNRANLGYSLKVNHLADKTTDELSYLRGSRYSSVNHGARPFPKLFSGVNDVPDHMDWRLRGAVTPVKDQAVCGSCWSFGTTGTVEGAHFLKTGNLVRLSQQELMDCSWGEGNNACDGGEDFRSYKWIMKNGGLSTEEQYGMYTGQDGYCHAHSVTPVAKIKEFVNVTSGDLAALKLAIFKYGPISVGIDASHKSLSFYANGVYYEPKCGNKVDDLDHAVLAVGYGRLNNKPYWLIKNSWSTYWGNDGYVLMSQENNNCGVATAATFVVM